MDTIKHQEISASGVSSEYYYFIGNIATSQTVQIWHLVVGNEDSDDASELTTLCARTVYPEQSQDMVRVTDKTFFLWMRTPNGQKTCGGCLIEYIDDVGIGEYAVLSEHPEFVLEDMIWEQGRTALYGKQ